MPEHAAASLSSPYYTPEHEAFRETVRRFVASAMLKNQATQTLAFCASEAVQILGGAGFVRGSKVERIYREVKVNAIGGGAEEIMKDLAARQMGW
jgi:alkylation response protein AidB-like acyl-CoA dehydrogenase